MSKKDGGPAFPSEGEGFGDARYHTPGMSLRDYFAGQALAGVITLFPPDEIGSWRDRQNARIAYGIADAMLAERDKTHD